MPINLMILDAAVLFKERKRLLFTAGSMMTFSVCGIPAMATTFLNTAFSGNYDRQQDKDVRQNGTGQAPKGDAPEDEIMDEGDGKEE